MASQLELCQEVRPSAEPAFRAMQFKNLSLGLGIERLTNVIQPTSQACEET
jgi:hypothetical protein